MMWYVIVGDNDFTVYVYDGCSLQWSIVKRHWSETWNGWNVKAREVWKPKFFKGFKKWLGLSLWQLLYARSWNKSPKIVTKIGASALYLHQYTMLTLTILSWPTGLAAQNGGLRASEETERGRRFTATLFRYVHTYVFYTRVMSQDTVAEVGTKPSIAFKYTRWGESRTLRAGSAEQLLAFFRIVRNRHLFRPPKKLSGVLDKGRSVTPLFSSTVWDTRVGP